ncbi:MAG: NAD(P)-dependent oxidoreductase [Methylobacteriaceae bacterium]|nr:NAD(P)-dependent oxidoreductase [Methylobacteriaceae bacterium]
MSAASEENWPDSIAVIGLGIMGSAVARHLVAAGRDVIGFDTDAPRAQAVAERHLRLAASAAAAAAAADLLLTSLPTEESLDATVTAVLGARRRPKQVLVELSTLSLSSKLSQCERLAAAGIAMLDTPISGTGAQAAAGDLVLYVSGDAEATRRCLPVFSDFSHRAICLGVFGNGTKVKFIANLLVAVHNVAAAEALSLGLRCGLDPATLCDVLAAGAGQSRMLEVRGPMMVRDIYEPPTMKLDVWQKDMRLIKAFAEESGAATPLFDTTIPLYRSAAVSHGLKDTAAVRLAIDGLAGSDSLEH